MKNKVRKSAINWFGREAHPSDELIHWQDQSSFARGWGLSFTRKKTFNDYIDELRAAWDLVHGDGVDPKVKAAFDLLAEARAHKTNGDAADDAAGEDL